MYLSIDDPTRAELFSQLFQPIKNVTDSFNMIFQEDKLYVQCMDAGMIVIMILQIPKEWFSTYTLEQAETIGLNSSLLSKVLSMKDKSQGIVFSTNEDDGGSSDQLFVKFHCDDNKLVFDKTFHVPLIELQTELLEIPSMEYSADFSLPSIVFSSLIHQLKQFGETMHIECTEEHIKLIAESTEYGKMETHIPIQDLEEYVIEENGTIQCLYALKYLNMVCMYQKVSKQLVIGVSQDYPMRIQCNMEDDAKILFYLAPREQD